VKRWIKISLIGIGVTLLLVCLWMIAHATVAIDAMGPIRIVEDDGGGSIKLFVVGDTGSQDARQQSVSDAMEAYCRQQSDFAGIVLLGDNFYPNGVDSVDDPQWQPAVWQPLGSECLSKLKVYPILGNHDRKGKVRAQLEASKKFPRWVMPGRFYSVHFGKLLTIAQLDSTRFDTWFALPGTYVDALQKSFEASPTEWQVVTSHHPYMSHCSDRPKREDPLKMASLRRQFCGKADAWISGHVHLMEHSEDLAQCAAPQFIVGSGGGELMSDAQCSPAAKFARIRHGFAVLEASPDQLQFRFVSVEGKELYRWGLQR
jgi:acid phosphatase